MPQDKKQIINNKLKCSKCNKWVDIEDFGNNKYKSTGKQSYCKYCRKIHYDNKRPRKSQESKQLKGHYEVTCILCGTKALRKSPKSVYCSKKCMRRDWYEKNERKVDTKSNTILN